MRSIRLARYGTGAACIALMIGVGVVGLPGVAGADPEGSVTTFTADSGSDTKSLFLGADDTLYVSGYNDASFGNGTVQALPTTEDSASAVVASFNLVDLPAGAIGATAVAAGPTTGTFAGTVLASSDNDGGFSSCGGSSQSVIQAYDPAPWNLRQTWTLPPGHCAGAMAVGPDGQVWFQEEGNSRIGRLNLDDSTVEFIAFPGANQSSAGRVGVGLDGNMYFAVSLPGSPGSGGLLIVGTGMDGTTLDDTQLLALPPNTVAYDLIVAENGDVWILASEDGVWVYRPSVGAFVARTGTLADSYLAKSIAQTSDGTMWVLGSDYSNSRYYAYVPQFTPSTNPSVVNLAAYSTFTINGDAGLGYIVAGPDGQGTLYRSTWANSIQRVGVAVAPQIVSIEPSQGPSLGGSTAVISGTGLNSDTSVTIGGNAATIDDSTATMLTVTVPPGSLGLVDVVVTSPDGDDTLVDGFEYADTVPAEPVLDSATGGDASIEIAWTEGFDGGSPVSAIYYAIDGYTQRDLGTLTSPATITTDSLGNPLQPGTTYTVRIQLRNAIGYSNWSNVLTATPTDPTPPAPPVTNPPGPPTGVVAVAGDSKAEMSWTPPVNEGSFAVTNYQVIASPGGAACVAAAPATSCVVERLTNGVTYTFTAQALNGAGWSVVSEPSEAVTPNPPPVEPSILITGSRVTINGRGGVEARGITTGLAGATVQARVHLAGEVDYYNGSQRRVSSAETFIWQRLTNKKVYAYFTTLDRTVRSNRIVITVR